MIRRTLLACLAVAAFSLTAGNQVFAQGNNPIITLDEAGHGTLVFPGGPPTILPFAMQPDPGPGGLTSTLTYNLLGPPALVAGDLIVLDPGTFTLSDIIRFNPSGTGGVASYPASVVFYSALAGSGETPQLADTGFPTALYTNNLTIFETIGPSGDHFTYTPTAGQPGFVAGFGVTYNFTSSVAAVPEPGPLALSATAGLVGVGASLVRRRRRAV